MKSSLIAALTAASLGTPLAAQENDPVHDCFMDRVDQEMESLFVEGQGFVDDFTNAVGVPPSNLKMEATYEFPMRDAWIDECENSTGAAATQETQNFQSLTESRGNVTASLNFVQSLTQ